VLFDADTDFFCGVHALNAADPGAACRLLADRGADLTRGGGPYACSGGEPACRPGSVPAKRAAVIHLGLPLPAASCGLPASLGRAALKRSRRPAPRSGAGPLDLAPGGVYRAAAVTCGAGGLLHHRFTLTPAPAWRAAGRFAFCGTVPRVTPGRRYRPPCPVEPGPSSPGRSPARPPGRLTSAT
jgi:hypothetical protein